jgi:hypothetical protein
MLLLLISNDEASALPSGATVKVNTRAASLHGVDLCRVGSDQCLLSCR